MSSMKTPTSVSPAKHDSKVADESTTEEAVVEIEGDGEEVKGDEIQAAEGDCVEQCDPVEAEDVADHDEVEDEAEEENGNVADNGDVNNNNNEENNSLRRREIAASAAENRRREWYDE